MRTSSSSVGAPALAVAHSVELRLIDWCHITRKSARVSAVQGHGFNFVPAGSSAFPTQFGTFKEGRRAFKYFFLTAPERNYLLGVDNCCHLCLEERGRKKKKRKKTTSLISRSWPISSFCGSFPSCCWHFGRRIHHGRGGGTGIQCWSLTRSVFLWVFLERRAHAWSCRPREPLHMQIWLRERLIIRNVPILASPRPALLHRYRHEFPESRWWNTSWFHHHTWSYSVSNKYWLTRIGS